MRDHERRSASSASRVYWAMTHVMGGRMPARPPPTWRDPQAVDA
ncbi:hypothetical protein [Streptomyces sp. NL15-2K]|nr:MULTISPECIES: hypothetical protein [Actinomycetes]WKX14191.1 hypothetical protein Q4V64_44415 [Kutzneria buriramensis]